MKIIFKRFFYCIADLVCKDDMELDETQNKFTNFETEIQSLKRKIKSFMAVQLQYTIKRLLPADVKYLYNNKVLHKTDLAQYNHRLLSYLVDNHSESTGTSTKGGIRLLFVNYNW